MFVEIKILPRKNEGTSKSSGNPPRALVLKCDGCGSLFEKKWLKETHEAKRHYCNIQCHYSNRGGIGGYGAEILQLACLSCSKTIKVRKIGNERKWGKTCSKKCYGAYRAAHPELYEKNTSAMHTEESWKKISDYVQEKMSQPGWEPHFRGKHHSEESKEKLREAKKLNPPTGEKNGMFGRSHTKEAREKMSESNSLGIISGSRKTYGKNGHVRGEYETKTKKIHHYRSSWELATMEHLDVNPNVSSWDYECIRIPYYYENNKRWYVPDFLIEFSDGRKEIWEIKPKELIDTTANKLKTEAALKFCPENGINDYYVLTRDELESRGIL